MTHSVEQTAGSVKTLTCPICHEQFTCSLSSTCWCASRKVPTEVRDYLAGRYENCVCSTCLDRLIEQSGSGESA